MTFNPGEIISGFESGSIRRKFRWAVTLFKDRRQIKHPQFVKVSNRPYLQPDPANLHLPDLDAIIDFGFTYSRLLTEPDPALIWTSDDLCCLKEGHRYFTPCFDEVVADLLDGIGQKMEIWQMTNIQNLLFSIDTDEEEERLDLSFQCILVNHVEPWKPPNGSQINE